CHHTHPVPSHVIERVPCGGVGVRARAHAHERAGAECLADAGVGGAEELKLSAAKEDFGHSSTVTRIAPAMELTSTPWWRTSCGRREWRSTHPAVGSGAWTAKLRCAGVFAPRG